MNPNNQQPQIESKNLSILEDQLKQEAVAHKVCQQYSQDFTDLTARGVAQQIAQHHKQRFDALANYLDSHK